MPSRTEIRAASLAACTAATLACGFRDPVEDDVGDAPYCDDVAEWEGNWSALEIDLVQEINSVRGGGGKCGGQKFDFAVELDLSPPLRCAARKHVRDMARQRELVHEGLDGTTFLERADEAEYEGIPRAELLAMGQSDAPAVVEAWLASEEHCPQLHERAYDEVGAGVFQTQDTLWWVLTLGSRRR